jgi:hypothetical protein
MCVYFTYLLPLEEGGESEYVKLLYVLAPHPVGGALLWSTGRDDDSETVVMNSCSQMVEGLNRPLPKEIRSRQ